MSGAFRLVPCFLRPSPFAPPAPRQIVPASPRLWRGQTSRDRASLASAFAFPMRTGAVASGQSRDLPVPVQGASVHARVSDLAELTTGSQLRLSSCCLPPNQRRRRSGVNQISRSNGCPIRSPADASRSILATETLTARGRCRLLLLHRSGLAPPTPWRS